MITWTKADITEFKRLIDLGASRDQMDRINSRLEMPKFVRLQGKLKCEAMYDVILNDGPLDDGQAERDE